MIGKPRFLYDNLLDIGETTTSIEGQGFVQAAVKRGLGSAGIVTSGTFTGQKATKYTIIIDDITGGESVGQSTFKWYEDQALQAISISTSLVEISLSEGVAIRFVTGAGDDFELGDQFDFYAINPFGLSNINDRDRSSRYRADDTSVGIAWSSNLDNEVPVTIASPKLWVRGGRSDVWQDSARTVPASPGDTLGAIDDLSGKANHALQTFTANEPGYTGNALNGRPVIEWNGTTSYLDVNHDSEFITPPFTMVWYGKFDQLASTKGEDYYLFNTPPVALYSYRLRVRSATDKLDFLVHDTSNVLHSIAGITTITPSIWRLIAASVDENGNMLVHVDDSQEGFNTTPDVYNAVTGPLRLGALNEFVHRVDGQSSDILMYNKALSASELSTLIGYFNLAQTQENADQASAAQLLMDSIIIQDHNLTDSAVITLKGDPAADFDNPEFSQTIAHVDKQILEYFTQQNYQHVQLSISDAGNVDGYIEMSELFIGEYAENSKSLELGYGAGIELLIDRTQTRAGVVQRRYRDRRKIISGTLLLVDDSDIEKWDAMIDLVADKITGIIQPIWFNLDSDNTAQTWLMELNSFSYTVENIQSNTGIINYNIDLELLEVIQGV